MNTEKSIVHFDTGRSWRGGQNQVYLLIRELKKYNIKQYLLAPPASPLALKVSGLNVKTYPLDPRNDFDFFSAFKLRKIIKKLSPGIIHFHSAKSLAAGLLALPGISIKKVYTKRVDFPLSGGPAGKLKYKNANIIVTVSDFIKKQLESRGFKNVVRVYSAVDTKKFTCPAKPGEKNTVTAGMAGALDLKHKDFITLIKAAAKLKHLNLNFIIAGKGKDEEQIKKLISHYKLEKKVIMKGFVDDMNGFFSSIDLLVHTVHYEGLGTVILQAMACGLPVVATQTGGIPEIVKDNINGFLVKKHNSRETASKIARLTEAPLLRKEMGKKAVETVLKKFSPENMAREYKEIYEFSLDKNLPGTYN